MQEVTYIDRSGELRQTREVFHIPDNISPEERQSRMNERYRAALFKVFAEGGRLERITQRRIGRNDPCPCGSGRKFKRCCESKMNAALNSQL